ncbi:hypothetical protein AVEN_9168-1 [Araneus ventricosus]|uniref:Uncharacterized protein n=1 Tax=Araneus ventricosus TaxID=182803 RepID=A0A4Y2NBE8_ARAVE|nr:hypothetical protein AVEN_9168-1 [Araneus ventricosus]
MRGFIPASVLKFSAGKRTRKKQKKEKRTGKSSPFQPPSGDAALCTCVTTSRVPVDIQGIRITRSLSKGFSATTTSLRWFRTLSTHLLGVTLKGNGREGSAIEGVGKND